MTRRRPWRGHDRVAIAELCSGRRVKGDCDGDLDSFDTGAFVLAVTNPTLYEETYPDCDIMNADINGDGNVDSQDIDAYTALLVSGNSATYVEHTWDAENRLTRHEPAGTLQVDDIKVELAYDYMGRRVRKQVYEWDGSEWDLIADTKFVWGGTGGSSASGWLLLLELDALDEDAVVRKYTWGMDLAGMSGQSRDRQGAGMLESAGGIGGLLAVYDAGEQDEYVYLHDANGNVGQVIDLSAASASAAINAHYEYDPYAGVVNQTGDYADENPFRFSTKYWDDETGLGYWGYRYYSPRLGRWLSRDPIGEVGGLNLYAYAQNNPIALVDRLGLDWVPINGKWDAWLTGNAVTRLLNSAVEKNPVYWLLRFLARHGSQGGDSFELSNDTAVDAFMHSMMFSNILRAVENDAHIKAGKLKCVPGVVITGRGSGSQNGGDTVEWHNLRLVSPLTYVIQQFRYEAKWDCYLEKRCWCCKNGTCGQQRRVQCLLKVKGWDKYDFHAPDDSIPPFKWAADGLQWLGGSFFLDWHATFRLRRDVRTWDCGDGTPRPSQTW